MKIKRNFESGHIGHESEWEPPRWVKALIFALIIGAMLLAAQCRVHGAETNAPAHRITDLGVITADTIIQLKPCERRADFARFKIEILPRNARGWTNKVEIQTTNDFLRLDDLAAVPEGRALMGVRSYCANGDSSPVSLFRIDVQRDPPDPPTASVSHVLRMPKEQKIEHVLDSMNAPTPPPPAPPGMTKTNAPSPVPTRTSSAVKPFPTEEQIRFEVAHALPSQHGGETYAQYQWRLEQAAKRGERLKNMR